MYAVTCWDHILVQVFLQPIPSRREDNARCWVGAGLGQHLAGTGFILASAGATCNYNVLIHTPSTLHDFISVLLLFILKVFTLYRVSFLLLFIIICSYLSLVLARETYILYNLYI